MSYTLEIIQDQIEKILYPEKFADYNYVSQLKKYKTMFCNS
jgi:hypothetical protein